MKGLKSSVNGDEREETPVGIDSLSNSERDKMLIDLKNQIDELKRDQTRPAETAEELDILDDYMDEPAVFFSFAYEYSVHSDVRRGEEVLPPVAGFIKFKPLYRYSKKSPSGRGQEVISVSQTVVRSRATAEWLRNHTMFGFKFFEKINDVKSVDTTIAEKMAEVASRLSGMNDYQIIERAKLENVPLHQDIGKLRKELADKIARKELAQRGKKMQEEFSAERDDNNRKVEYSDKKIAEADNDVY